MNLRPEVIESGSKSCILTEALIKSAFPPDEQEPMSALISMAQNPMVNFWAYYDEDTYCGFCYVVESPRILFVLYLAVPGELRSKGYGAAILEDVRARFGGKDIVLHVEDPDKNENKRTERERRIKFYERNGFSDTGWRIDNKDDCFFLISTAENFHIDMYMELMRLYSKGEYTPPVYLSEERN